MLLLTGYAKEVNKHRQETVSVAAGSGAVSSWYIDKLRRAYGPQLILMNALNETYKLLQVYCHFLGAN